MNGRVAIKRSGAMSPFARAWFLSGMPSKQLREVAEKKAEYVLDTGRRLLVAYPHSARDRAHAATTTMLGALARTDAALLSAYFKAIALEVSDPFVEGLPGPARRQLGTLLGSILRKACVRLHWSTDLRLGMFELYDRSLRPDEIPDARELSRLGALFEGHRALERVGSHYGTSSLSDDYYESIARGFALAADVADLGNTLAALPAGRTVLIIADRLVQFRPTVLAALLSHPAWAPEAAFCLSTFLRRDRHHSFRDLDLIDEWQEVQVILRRRLLERTEPPDVASAVDLALHDERADESGRHAPRGMRHTILSSAVRERVRAYWDKAIKGPGIRTRVVAEVESRITHERLLTVPMAALALRFVDMLRAADAVEDARRVARTLVSAYERRISADGVLDLTHRADLLGNLLVLSADSPGWATWLRPFDVGGFLDAALREQNERDASSDRRMQFAAPRAVARHVRNLLVLTEEAGPSQHHRTLTDAAADAFFEDRARPLHVRSFGWQEDWIGLVPGSATPAIVLIARVLAKAGPDCHGRIRALLRASPSLFELAQWGWGIGREHPLFREVVGHVRDLVAETDVETLALGESAPCALALLHCGLDEEAERFARSTLETARSFQRRMLHPTEYTAVQVLMSTLANRAAWNEILSFDDGGDLPPEWIAVVANWRAVALLQKEDLPAALAEIERVLRVDKKNAMARGNQFIAYVMARRWKDVQDLLSAGTDVLADLPDDVRRTAAEALSSLGDDEHARRLLAGASPLVAGAPPPMRTVTSVDVLPPRDPLELELIDGIMQACAKLARSPTLFEGRKEDEITAMVDIALSRLAREFRVGRGQPQGFGEREGHCGVTDLTITHLPTERVVVTGEQRDGMVRSGPSKDSGSSSERPPAPRPSSWCSSTAKERAWTFASTRLRRSSQSSRSSPTAVHSSRRAAIRRTSPRIISAR